MSTICRKVVKCDEKLCAQWNLYNADTIGAISSVLSKEVYLLRRFPVGVAMRTRTVERYEGAFQRSPLL